MKQNLQPQTAEGGGSGHTCSNYLNPASSGQKYVCPEFLYTVYSLQTKWCHPTPLGGSITANILVRFQILY